MVTFAVVLIFIIAIGFIFIWDKVVIPWIQRLAERFIEGHKWLGMGLRATWISLGIGWGIFALMCFLGILMTFARLT